MHTLPITFAFSTDSAFILQLEAEVELPDSVPHYQVKNIHLARNHHHGATIIPDMTLKCLLKQDKRIWVHADSDMPSDLSTAVGKDLENILPTITIASENDPIEEDDLYLA
jgi:hypothetical protein